LRQGADPNAKAQHGVGITQLKAAMDKGHGDSVEVQKKAGAKK